MENECLLKCTSSVENAREKLRSKKIRFASYDLIYVFQMTKHKSDNHKQLENEALNLIIDAFGQDENPGEIYIIIRYLNGLCFIGISCSFILVR